MRQRYKFRVDGRILWWAKAQFFWGGFFGINPKNGPKESAWLLLEKPVKFGREL